MAAFVMYVFPLLVFAYLAWGAVSGIYAVRQLFIQHAQNPWLMISVTLFPLSPIILIGLKDKSALIAALVASLCYIPAWALSRRATKAFRTVGTDQTIKAEKAASSAHDISIGGLVYVLAVYIFWLTVASYESAA